MQLQTALPEGVRKQAERARELMANQGNPGGGGEQHTLQGNGNTEAQQRAAPSEVERLREQLAQLSGELATATSRYNVLNGKYQAELPRASTRIRQLEAEIASLKANPPSQAAAAADIDLSTVDLLQYFTQADIGTYGEPLLRGLLKANAHGTHAVVTAAAKTEAERVAAPLHQEAEQRRLRDEQEATERSLATEARFQADLSIALPGWEQQNEDAGFMAWLNQYDQKSGRSRFALLKDAHATHDSATAIDIFKAFRERREIGASTTPTQHLQSPGAGQGAGQNPGGQPEGKIWTRAEISTHYSSVTKGHFKGRDADKKRIDSDIIAAGREGRIRG